jgi:hypothetical protein
VAVRARGGRVSRELEKMFIVHFFHVLCSLDTLANGMDLTQF